VARRLLALLVLAAAPASGADLSIAWKYQDLPEGVSMTIHEPAAGRAFKLWEMGVGDKAAMPVAGPISESLLRMNPGSKKAFVLVFHNPSDQPVYFFAAPHVADPPEYSLGFKFKCLCVNHVYEVPPGKYWYRVVEMRLAPKFTGKSLEVRHTLIGVSKERMLEFNSSPNTTGEHSHGE
jgi:hypothetical protein